MNPSNYNSANGDRISHNDETIRILIVDDQRMIREGLKALIKTETDLEVVGTADDGKDAIKQVDLLKPNIVLMDMEMSGMNGVEATRQICEKYKQVKVLVLSTYDNEDYVTRSLGAGAMGYLLKGTPAKELTEAIRSIHRGYAQIGPTVIDKVISRNRQTNEVGAKIPQATVLTKPKQTSPSQDGVAPTPTKPDASKSNGKLATTSTKKSEEEESALAINNRSSIASRPFDQTVVLRQSPKWSEAIVWAIVGVTTFGIAWAFFAKIEQVVPAQGQLQPLGKVKEIQVPTNGVVQSVAVEDGEQVEKGELLLRLDSTTSEAQLDSFNNILQSLSQENKFYRALMQGDLGESRVEQVIQQLEIPREIAFLARNRAELMAENQLFRAQLGDSANTDNLTPEQRARLRASQTELSSRAEAARLEIEQLERQYNQNQVQLADARKQLATSRQVLSEIESRNQQAIAQAEESLEIERNLLSSIEPLVKEGALSQVQLDRQRQEVNDRNSELVQQRSAGQIEYDRQKQERESLLAEIDRLSEEQQRLRLDIAQSREELINTTAFSEKDVLDRIAENTKRIAEIDTQLNKSIVENDKRVAEIKGQIAQAEQNIKYEAIYAPVTGTIFDLQAYPGYVPPAGQAAEPVMKIVPDDNLVAEVYITNKDIGFVEEGMKTDVRIDAFPFSEFGDVKGEISFIGANALPPDQTYNFFRFPAKIKLDSQTMNIRGREIPLQAGMSVSTNIKIDEDRTVMRLFADRFIRGIDSFKKVQ